MVMRQIDRRQFAKGLALAPVWVPSMVFAQDAASVLTLTAARTRSQLLGAESPPTEHLHFATATGAPILRAKQGVEFHFRLFNETDEDIFLHFFGLRGPSNMTTVHAPPQDRVGTEVVFTPPDAGTFWFGPLLQASRQRELGLSGLLIVEDADATPYQDIPLIIDDWLISDAGVIDADFTNLNRAAGEGRLGNWFTVNGQFKPRISLDPEKPARLRLLNVANTRSINIMFKGVEGVLLARDGQAVWPQPLGLRSLSLAPGQRADVLLLEAQPLVTIAFDLFEDVVEAAFLEASGYGRKTLPRDTRLLANPLPELNEATPPRSFDIALEGGLKGGLRQAMVGKDVLDLRAMLEQGLAWAMGGRSGLGSPPLFDARKGETVALVFENKTSFEQVLHVHGHVWSADKALAADREGPVWPRQWSDTLVIPAGARQKVLMVADNPGTWAIQSLLAERSDAGLIAAFTVSDMP
jgi:FtsP/CotA-like multicopper oxidase with cupredoxin domain